MPPCFEKTDEKFYIYSDVPHTHRQTDTHTQTQTQTQTHTHTQTDRQTQTHTHTQTHTDTHTHTNTHTQTHTCSEQLFELLTWNVSFVQSRAEHLAKNGMTAAVCVLKWTEARLGEENPTLTCRSLAWPGAISDKTCEKRSCEANPEQQVITTWQVRHWTPPVISSGHCRELC